MTDNSYTVEIAGPEANGIFDGTVLCNGRPIGWTRGPSASVVEERALRIVVQHRAVSEPCAANEN